jgi:anaerobic selenocysteine-containing dehydrogenase
MAALGDRRGPDRLLDLLLRAGPYGEGFGTDPDGLSVAKLEADPHGIDLGPLEPRVPDVLSTASGRIELAVPLVLDELSRLEDQLDEVPDGPVLIGRRHLRTNNSWSHNVAGLTKGQQLCTLQVHPEDAGTFGVSDGGAARVRSRAGEITVTVEVTEDLRRGVVSLPHGFGHDLAGVELSVARTQGGANSNVLTDRDDVDPLSGTAVLNGIPVEVTPA